MQWRMSQWKGMAQKRSAVEEGGGEPSSGIPPIRRQLWRGSRGMQINSSVASSLLAAIRQSKVLLRNPLGRHEFNSISPLFEGDDIWNGAPNLSRCVVKHNYLKMTFRRFDHVRHHLKCFPHGFDVFIFKRGLFGVSPSRTTSFFGKYT